LIKNMMLSRKEDLMKPLISIIVPIYNVEQYLNRCIESIVNQTYKNLEIILIDDGSIDHCPQICDEWQKKDNRIIVIHSKNKGAGNARNIGLKIAKGSFISFVDSDDLICIDFIEYLYSLFVSDIDIVECDFIHFVDEVHFYKKDKYINKEYNMVEAMKHHINDKIFKQVIWNKLYRKKIIESIYFPIGKQIDDEFWTYKIIANANRLIHSTKIGYAYRQQEQSVMHLLNAEKRLQAMSAKVHRHEYICKNIPMLEIDSLCNLWFTCIFQGQLILKTMNKQERKKGLVKLEKILQQYPIKKKKLNIVRKQRIWLNMARMSFYWTCLGRNILKIGL